MLSIHELNVFVEAAQLENFSIAAQRLCLSQPAVSLQIRNLERELGVDLFRRNGRNVTLSDAGRVLLPLAHDLLRQSKRIEEIMWGLQGRVIGELALACSGTVGKYVLPRLIAAFRRQYPAVQVTMHVLNRRSATDWLQDGRAQLAVISSPVTSRDLDLQSFLEEQIVLVVPSDHPWADGRTVKPADLLSLPLILREPQAGSYELLAEGLAQHSLGISDLNVVMTLGNAEAISASVEAGVGAAFLPRMVAARAISLGCQVEVPVEGLRLRRLVYLARHQRRMATPPQQVFWDFALDTANSATSASPIDVTTSSGPVGELPA